MKQKAQTEIVGIVIIVLIITIALLFYVASATNEDLTKSGKKLYDSYSSNEIATSLVQTLLNTYVDSCGVSFQEVVIDCGIARKTLSCGGVNSCIVAEEVAATVLNQTLDVWDYPYGMRITIDRNRNFTFIRHNCSATTVGRSAPGVFLIPYYPEPGTARVELGFCR